MLGKYRKRYFLHNKKRLCPSYGTKALLLLCHPRISSSFISRTAFDTRSLCNRWRFRQFLLGVRLSSALISPFNPVLLIAISPAATLFEFKSESTTLNHRFNILLCSVMCNYIHPFQICQCFSALFSGWAFYTGISLVGGKHVWFLHIK